MKSHIELSIPPTGNIDHESRTIYEFRTRIAPLIASSSDADFWNHDLLHNADAYRPVRHAVVALASAYHKSILLDCQVEYSDRFIFGQYDKAMRALSACFRDKIILSRAQQVAALIANFLFTCLCTLQGLRQEALVHLRNGAALIHEWGLRETSHKSMASNQEAPIRYIIAAYTKFGNQEQGILIGCDKDTALTWDMKHFLLRP